MPALQVVTFAASACDAGASASAGDAGASESASAAVAVGEGAHHDRHSVDVPGLSIAARKPIVVAVERQDRVRIVDAANVHAATHKSELVI